MQQCINLRSEKKPNSHILDEKDNNNNKKKPGLGVHFKEMLAEREGWRGNALLALKMLSKDKHTDTALQEACISIASVKYLQLTEHVPCWLPFLNTHYNRK